MESFLLDKIAAPQRHSQASKMLQIREQVQRLVEGHRVVAASKPLDILGLELGDKNTKTAVVDIGVQSFEDQKQYAAQLQEIIHRYEPRIKQPRVSVVPADNSFSAPSLSITGLIETDSTAEEFHFSAELG